ncbi:hypothetical protein P389DRAFT_93156 [Cystobasidium minutum MCA 4210]|uniref:uncharacterized protein n=1 Tax=Cystobasidium minutum MCA 4210 TaxID=1397322 RepID=UPI0034CFC168|eukprot:jgi/Rhomi1/93156/CE93155_928
MKDVPVEILSLILTYLQDETASGPVGTIPNRDRAAHGSTAATIKDLLSCCLVNKGFLAEAQPLLHQIVRISKRHEALRWLPDRLGVKDTARHIRTLHLNCLETEAAIMQLLDSTSNLRYLTLEAGNVESRDCLAECINTSLMRHTHLQSITLTGLTSIKTLAIVYNLPYRLTHLGVSGLYKYKGALWDNCIDCVNAESISFTGLKVSDKWDMYFLFQLCEVHPAMPPTSLTFHQCQVSFDFLPESTYITVKEIHIFDAPKLLELDQLGRFRNLQDFTISAMHDFIKLSTPITTIKRITLRECEEGIAKLFTQWICKGYFPSLEDIFITGSQSQNSADQARLLELRTICRDRLYCQ